MITQRAVLVGFVGFCFYLIALVNGLQNYSYTLAWMAAGILASSLALALLSLVGLECRWNVVGARAAESLDANPDGGPFLEIEMSNAGTLNKTGVLLIVRLRDERRDTLRTQRFLLEALPSGGSLRTTISLSGLPRGRYRVEELRLIGSDVLGLFRVQKRAQNAAPSPDENLRRVRLWNDQRTPMPRVMDALQTATQFDPVTAQAITLRAHNSGSALCFRGPSDACEGVVAALREAGLRAEVIPDQDSKRPFSRRDIVPAVAPQLVIGPAMAGGNGRRARESAGLTGRGDETARALGQGDEFKGTRPYAPGDDLRRVHWSSSARRGALVVREFHSPAQSRCAVIWDGAQREAGSRRQGAGGRRQEAGSRRREAEDRKKTASASPASRLLPPASDAAAETGLRFAVSLWRALQSGGRPCGLLKLDARPQWMPPVPLAARSTLEAEAVARVLELFAEADFDRIQPLRDALRPFRAELAAIGDLFLVTSAPPSQWREVASRGLGAHSGSARLTVIFVDAQDASGTGTRDGNGAASGAQFVMRAPRAGEDALAPVRAALAGVLSASAAPIVPVTPAR